MGKKCFVSENRFLLISLVLAAVILVNSFSNTQVSALKEKQQSLIPTKQYDLLAITTKTFAHLLTPLIKHKEEVGISTKLVTLHDVYKQMFWQGRDEPEKIKYFIKNAIEKWNIKYVLLVGGIKQIPVRYSNVHCFNLDEPDWKNHLLKSRFISDLYYADIYDSSGNFSSWDSNNNGVYGEWTDDDAEDKGIDLYPDVYVGRLPCRNKIEVKIMVNKIISYERNSYGKPWFKNVVVVAGDTDPRWWIPRWRKYEGEVTAREILEYMEGFNHIKLFPSNGKLKGRKDVINAINKGCGFIYFNGHGNPLGCVTFKPRTYEWVRCIDIYTIPFLFNGRKLPICIIGACSSCDFSASILNIFNETAASEALFAPECWGWWITRKIGGGAIATIGSTGIGFVNLDKRSGVGAGSYLEKRFFWEYGVNNTEILGEMWGKAIKNYLDTFPINWSEYAGSDSSIDAETVESYILIGDPTLKIGGYPLGKIR